MPTLNDLPALDAVAAVLETTTLQELLAESNRSDLTRACSREVRAAIVRELVTRTDRDGGRRG